VTLTHETGEPAVPAGEGGLIRLRLDLSYDGTDFFGWAPQPGLRTVAPLVEESLRLVLRLPQPPRVTVAGRTDTGVHATGQVVHVDVPGPVDLAVLARRLTGVLPPDVAVWRVSVAPAGFHARFSAVGRRYAYRVSDGIPDPVRRRDTVSWPRRLDVELIDRAARPLVGQHDFSAYCKARPGGTTIRSLHELEVTREAEVIVIQAYGDAFCHHQVRSMIGALLAVGEGRRTPQWPAEVLRRGVRDSLVNMAPARGLSLVAVDYPPDEELLARAELTRQRRT
jgi:tRNA pseudouridine38-40 synthase